MNTVVSGLLPISKFLEKRDTTSLQRWLSNTARNTPVTHYRKEESMNNQHREMPGSGVAFFEEEKKSEKGPDFKGFIVLEMDYKAGEKLKFAVWQRPTSKGTSLLSFKEDNWTKRKKQEEREAYQAEVVEVTPAYKKPRVDPRIRDEDDSEIPF
jgi:hypothetical protein